MGKSKSSQRREKIKILLQEGYAHDQAIAIAFSMFPDKRRVKSRDYVSKYRRSGKTAWQEQSERRKGGHAVNAWIAEPQQLCEAVTAEFCAVCGEFYANTILKAGTIQDASDSIRQAAKKEQIRGGGYRTRGPLLWQLHIMKLNAWYLRHAEHCAMVEELEFYQGSGFVAVPPSVIWIESFGTRSQNKLADRFMKLWKDQENEDPFRDYTRRPLKPSEYSDSMIRQLEMIWKTLDTSVDRTRKRLDLPSRRVEGEKWLDVADSELRLSPQPQIQSEELPF